MANSSPHKYENQKRTSSPLSFDWTDLGSAVPAAIQEMILKDMYQNCKINSGSLVYQQEQLSVLQSSFGIPGIPAGETPETAQRYTLTYYSVYFQATTNEMTELFTGVHLLNEPVHVSSHNYVQQINLRTGEAQYFRGYQSCDLSPLF
jgi:hypothetical protein